MVHSDYHILFFSRLYFNLFLYFRCTELYLTCLRTDGGGGSVYSDVPVLSHFFPRHGPFSNAISIVHTQNNICVLVEFRYGIFY
jgi:hypothetical protein